MAGTSPAMTAECLTLRPAGRAEPTTGVLFGDLGALRLVGVWLARRKRYCEPGIPAGRTVRRIELPIALEIETGLHRAGREGVVDLRANAHDARLELANVIAGSAVGTDLVIDIADGADKDLLRHRLRERPIEVPIDAAQIIRIRVDEVIGGPRHHRKLGAF